MTTLVPDILEALVAYLLTITDVTDLAGSAIFDSELPLAEDIDMPTYAVVLGLHGGPASPKTIQLHDSRVMVTCYGATPHLAHVMYVNTYQALKDLTPSVYQNTYVHWCNEAAGPINYRDLKLQWPYNVSSWIVRASDLAIP